MRKLILMVSICLLGGAANAQVFGSGQTLKEGTFNVGVLPTILTSGGNDDFMLFLQGGYGLRQGVDLGVKLGVLGDESYIGADVEFALMKNLSLTGGVHSFNDFGLDFTGLYTFDLSSNARLTSGLDMDVVFAESETLMPLWIPINVEVDIKKNMVFILEVEIDTKLIDESFNLIAGGVQFYF